MSEYPVFFQLRTLSPKSPKAKRAKEGFAAYADRKGDALFPGESCLIGAAGSLERGSDARKRALKALASAQSPLRSIVVSFQSRKWEGTPKSKAERAEFLRRTVAEFARDCGLSLDNLDWVGAFHETTGHLHAHLMVWEKARIRQLTPVVAARTQRGVRQRHDRGGRATKVYSRTFGHDKDGRLLFVPRKNRGLSYAPLVLPWEGVVAMPSRLTDLCLRMASEKAEGRPAWSAPDRRPQEAVDEARRRWALKGLLDARERLAEAGSDPGREGRAKSYLAKVGEVGARLLGGGRSVNGRQIGELFRWVEEAWRRMVNAMGRPKAGLTVRQWKARLDRGRRVGRGWLLPKSEAIRARLMALEAPARTHGNGLGSAGARPTEKDAEDERE